jgi:hypothetical protein
MCFKFLDLLAHMIMDVLKYNLVGKGFFTILISLKLNNYNLKWIFGEQWSVKNWMKMPTWERIKDLNLKFTCDLSGKKGKKCWMEASLNTVFIILKIK